MEGLEKVDREDLKVWDEGTTRGHRKKWEEDLGKNDIKKHSCPCRTIQVQSVLARELVEATTMHYFKMKLDIF
ncbi:hypothetical protein E2C01_079185 [Portunus trituberculatus]|uniref:Uncharacterized protein n=1 Tax=Portunus trituberculatus TaxID=210409 RepID=A0A5B7ISM5_PORTR|nr:hypothetical protein [Portunus trituberculatus]